MADDNIITLSQIWSEIPFNTEASLKGMGACVDDQIWQV
jgi:hypothetical protein